eukprot:4902149-Prymnesium_polylepis.1
MPSLRWGGMPSTVRGHVADPTRVQRRPPGGDGLVGSGRAHRAQHRRTAAARAAARAAASQRRKLVDWPRARRRRGASARERPAGLRAGRAAATPARRVAVDAVAATVCPAA